MKKLIRKILTAVRLEMQNAEIAEVLTREIA